ncbi:MAG: Fe-S cluster assembly protein SufD [Deltaproteobacteria bacterium]|nr:Fe-S cluster assembly protein SufD [Deltaproteobacteria bacterium]
MISSELNALRQKCADNCLNGGWPTGAVEEFKFTSLAELSFWPCDLPLAKQTNLSFWQEHKLTDDVIVFENGQLSQNTLSAQSGLTISSFSSLDEISPDMQAQFANNSCAGQPFISQLNTAYFTSGLVLRISKNQSIDKPIQIIFAQSSKEAASFFAKVFIVLEAGASCSVVETYVGDKQADNYLSCVQIEISLAEGAQLKHVKVGHNGESSYHLAGTRIHQAAHSNYEHGVFFYSGKLVRNEIYSVLQGQGADVVLKGLSRLDGQEVVDNFINVEHAAPNCTSNQRFKGIYDGKSHGVFTGTIVVKEGAQKTNGYQSNANILLSSTAKVDARPQLKIWADDVKCSHGETCGALDEEALFYLQARGIPQAQAKQMLVTAFAQEIIDGINIPGAKEYLLNR